MLRPVFKGRTALLAMKTAVCSHAQSEAADSVDCVNLSVGTECNDCVFSTVDNMLAFILEELEKE